MATRMQQRRGTASQWTSANPILNAGEMGWESDTNKFKIGDGTNHWADLDYFIDVNSTVNPAFGSSITFEGATANDFETTLTMTDPTADRTITFPDATGTVALTSDITVSASSTNTFSNKSISLASNTVTGTKAEFNSAMSDADFATIAGTETLTNKTLTTPTINGPTITDTGQTPTIHGIYLPAPHTIIFEGTTANDFETTLTAGEPTADRTITLPDETGTVQLRVTDVSDTEIGYLNGVTSAIQTQMDAKAPLAAPAFTGDATAVNLTISGNLTVDGTTTNINSTSLVVEDKNIVLGDTATPTDTTADGGGITLKGATDKTFNWVDSTDSWTSSEHINLASGKTLKYNGTDLVAAQSGNSGKYLTTDGTSTSWGTVSGYSAPTLGSTSIASGATVTTIVGLTKVRSDVFTTLDANGYEVDIETMTIMGAF
jgi:hypothetical protein